MIFPKKLFEEYKELISAGEDSDKAEKILSDKYQIRLSEVHVVIVSQKSFDLEEYFENLGRK